jgi:hypothetical protein
MVLKNIAKSELPTTTYIGRPNPTVINGTISGPPPKPNIDAMRAIENPPIHPQKTLILNSCPQNSIFMIIFLLPLL